MSQQVFLNHIGCNIDIQVVDDDTGEAIDVSSAGTKTVKIKGPLAASKSKTGAFIDDGSDGWVRYTTIDADLDEIGVWQVQGYFVISGENFHTEIGTFNVLPTL